MKQINLLEILKNAPKGLTMYSVSYGQVKVETIQNNKLDLHGFRLIHDKDNVVCFLDEYGRMGENGECVLFPNSVFRKWSDGWQNCLMIQEPCIGCVVVLDDTPYKIIAKNVVQTRSGHIKYAGNFEGWRFATEKETNEFHNFSVRANIHKINKYLNPGDLVLVRRQSTCESEQYRKWILGHFSHYDMKHDLYFTTECTAISADTMMGYYDCIPYMDATKSMLNTDQDIQFFTATIKW